MEIKSEFKLMSTGVPQGSSLAATLFNIFVNDIKDIKTKAKIYMYADDTALLYTEENYKLLYETIENDLLLFSEWFETNCLRVNIDKSNFMIISRSHYNNDKMIFMHSKDCQGNKCNCKKLKRTKQTKYLGLQLDENLKWSGHIKQVYNTINKILPVLYSMKNIVLHKNLKMIYYALLYPHIIYAIPIWSQTYGTHTNKIDKQFSKIKKYIFSKDEDIMTFDKIKLYFTSITAK